MVRDAKIEPNRVRVSLQHQLLHPLHRNWSLRRRGSHPPSAPPPGSSSCALICDSLDEDATPRERLIARLVAEEEEVVRGDSTTTTRRDHADDQERKVGTGRGYFNSCSTTLIIEYLELCFRSLRKLPR